MMAKETFDQVVAYLEEQGYFLTGWGGTSLDKGRTHEVLQIRKAGKLKLKKPKKTWGTLWLKENGKGWMIYCWLNKKADKLLKLAAKLEKKFNTKVEFCIIDRHK